MRVTGSDEPSCCCINAQGACLCSSGFPSKLENDGGGLDSRHPSHPSR